MGNQYDSLVALTSRAQSDVDRFRALNEFSHELGWKPSDRLDVPATRDLATAHLLVEHGLEYTAVLSFISQPNRFPEFTADMQLKLLSISYNNLVDWHLAIESDAVNFIYVRTRVPTVVARESLTRSNYDRLRREAFEQIVGRRPSPNIPALDDALIRTISLWKRNLSAELNGRLTTPQVSALFNALIFVRALEDNRRRSEHASAEDYLPRAWDRGQPLSTMIASVATELLGNVPPRYLLDTTKLSVFDEVDRLTIRSLLVDFYRNRYAPYRYDFSIISLHALSRIYEHYVSLLGDPLPSPQLSMLPALPEESIDRTRGAVYTPQFIARFFARYLREHVAPVAFRRLRSIDPACGSGIFLRTLLELQCDPLYDSTNAATISEAFRNVNGIDVDENAVHATRLSIALLYLVLLQELPQELHVSLGDAIETLAPSSAGHSFDVVITNPPFIPHDRLSVAIRNKVAEVLGEYGKGKNDLHLAFVKRGLEALRPGGLGLFVLPHSFLLGDHAKGLRGLLAGACWIRCLVDLSAVRVFDATGVYVILLIFQKRADNVAAEPMATVVKCQDFVGRALQDAVEGRKITTPHYSVYEVPQAMFAEPEWTILPPGESNLKRRLSSMASLGEFLTIREGIVTGVDRVFILQGRDIPKAEEPVYLPLLRDREMSAYGVPRRTELRVFYPYSDGERMDERVLRQKFPWTWSYLQRHRALLQRRSALQRYRKVWWEPLWARPTSMRRPKIVAPHLILLPKFSLDEKGRYGVTRSPILLAADDDQEMLRFFVAVLNSSACFWHISSHAHRYSRGYVMLEKKTLDRTPVPDPSRISTAELRTVLTLVDERLRQEGEAAISIERQLDNLVADLYKLTREERTAIGLETT